MVDQFEEIFRYREQARNVNDADAFVHLLLAATPAVGAMYSVSSGVPIYVIITMRSDFLGDCALFTGLPEHISDSQFLTPRLSRSQYESAIVEPARAFGGDLEPSLVNRLLNDLHGVPHQLPVLQHALMRMWTRIEGEAASSGKRLTLADYDMVGGLSEALSNHADEALQEIDTTQQALAKTVLCCLCERSSEKRDTRRPVKLAEVAHVAGVSIDEVKAVVEVFRRPDRSFIMPSAPTPLQADTTLDINHESLISQWHTLNTWVTAEANAAERYTRLEQDACTWEQFGKKGSLRSGPYLDMTLAWWRDAHPTANWARRYGGNFALAKEFLDASEADRDRQQREQEEVLQRELQQAQALAEAQEAYGKAQKARAEDQAKNARRSKWLAIMAIALAAIAVVGAYHARNQQQIAEEQQQIAEEQQQIAKNQRQMAIQQKIHNLALYSEATHQKQPPLSLLLAVEAAATEIPEVADVVEQALYTALTHTGGVPLHGHKGPISAVAFSPVGHILASWDWSIPVICLWDLTTTPPTVRNLEGHKGPISAVAFSLDGRTLVSGSADDPTIRLWDLTTTPPTARLLEGQEGPILALAFSPDGHTLASGSADITIRLWDLTTTPPTSRVLRGHEGPISALAFSSDGHTLVSGSTDATIRLWDPAAPAAAPRLLESHKGPILALAFSPDGHTLATGGWDAISARISMYSP